MNSYKFYLDNMLFPVNPSKMVCSYSNKNKTAELINGMEINILKQPGLTEFSFDALIPAVQYPFANYDGGFKTVDYYLFKLKKIKEKNEPVYFKVVRWLTNGSATFDTDDFKCTLEDYQYTESAGEGFDVVVSIKLKGFNDYGTVEFKVDETPGKAGVAVKKEERPAAKEVPAENNKESYTVKSGDTLWAICKNKYGDGAKYKEVAAKNGIADPNIIRAGQVIVLD